MSSLAPCPDLVSPLAEHWRAFPTAPYPWWSELLTLSLFDRWLPKAIYFLTFWRLNESIISERFCEIKNRRQHFVANFLGHNKEHQGRFLPPTSCKKIPGKRPASINSWISWRRRGRCCFCPSSWGQNLKVLKMKQNQTDGFEAG